MRILVIPYLPSAVRAKPIAKTLSNTGHEVHMITWTMPYPLTARNILDSFRHSWKASEYRDENVIMHKVETRPLVLPPTQQAMVQASDSVNL